MSRKCLESGHTPAARFDEEVKDELPKGVSNEYPLTFPHDNIPHLHCTNVVT